MRYLLDTHVLIWWYLDESDLPKRYLALLDEMEGSQERLAISIITLWEITKLTAAKRIKPSTSLDAWFSELASDNLIEILPLAPEIILDSSRLGVNFPRDPADQLIAATARHYALKLLTCDQNIIESGVVMVEQR